MPVPIVQSSQSVTFDGTNGNTATLGVPSCVVDEYVVAIILWDNAFGGSLATPTIGGSAMTALATGGTGGTSLRVSSFYRKVTSGGTNTISISTSLGSNRISCVLIGLRVSGAHLTSPLGATPINASGTSNTMTAGALASVLGRLVISVAGSGTVQAASGTVTTSPAGFSLDNGTDFANPVASSGQVWLGVGHMDGAASVTPTFNVPTTANYKALTFDLVPIPSATVYAVLPFIGPILMDGPLGLVADQFRAFGSTVRASAFVRVVNESMQLAENRLRFGVWLRLKNETVQLSEGTLRLGVYLRIRNEVMNLVEGALRFRTLLRIRNETLNVSESPTRVGTWLRITGDTLQLAEAASRVRTFVRVVNEVLRLTELTSSVKFFVRIVNETLRLVESVIRFRAQVRTKNETLNLSEATARPGVWLRIRNEVVQFSEGRLRFGSYVRVKNDTVQLVEGTLRFKASVRRVNEVLNLSENVGRAKTLAARIVNETLRLVEGAVWYRFATVDIRVTQTFITMLDMVTRIVMSNQITTVTMNDEDTDIPGGGN